MDLVSIWFDDRYWSKVLFTTIPTPADDLKVKVTELQAILASLRVLRIYFNLNLEATHALSWSDMGQPCDINL